MSTLKRWLITAVLTFLAMFVASVAADLWRE